MEGVNIFEGTPCPACSAPLHVVEVHTPTGCLIDDGREVNSSSYECAGPEPHLWGTWVDLKMAGPGRWKAWLVAKTRPAPPTQS